MAILETIEQLDRELLLAINQANNSWMDFMMWHISGKLQWIPFYLFLIYLVYKKLGKQLWIVLLFVALLVLACDQISVKLFKETFERYRPCHNLEIKEILHLVNNKCGGKFGFVSSHATNTFGLATFVGLVLGRKWLIILYFWASLVSYSRIYLGVHYPLDVIGGSILGLAIGYLMYFLMYRIFKEKLTNAL